jgi:hypothetical protein
MIACLLFTTSAFAETTKEEKTPCGDPSSMEEVLHEKGYFHLLDMKNENGVTTQLWTGGRSMVITAEKDKKICFVSSADEVTYNPVTLQKIIEVFKKTQKEL